MRLASIQMEITDGNPRLNRENLSNIMDNAISCDLCVAPELWSSGYIQEEWSDIASSDTPNTIKWMASESKRRRLWLGGSLINRDAEGFLVNEFMLFDPNGNKSCGYVKSHLFRPLKEHIFLKAGAVLPPIVNINGFMAAPSICYDLRFPEMYRYLALKGVNLFLTSAEWPYPRDNALKVMAEARAIENQAYLVLANRIGADSISNVYCGQSGVYGPDGVLVENGQNSGLISVEVDLEELNTKRREFPVLAHRVKNIDFEQIS